MAGMGDTSNWIISSEIHHCGAYFVTPSNAYAGGLGPGDICLHDGWIIHAASDYKSVEDFDGTAAVSTVEQMMEQTEQAISKFDRGGENMNQHRREALSIQYFADGAIRSLKSKPAGGGDLQVRLSTDCRCYALL